MKLFNSAGPNPRVVRMFAAEKGIDLPKQEGDIRGRESGRPSERVGLTGRRSSAITGGPRRRP
ncbi:MAG: hypothetical protein ACK4QW_01905 [Alphaproteobacteria bacterium]